MGIVYDEIVKARAKANDKKSLRELRDKKMNALNRISNNLDTIFEHFDDKMKVQ